MLEPGGEVDLAEEPLAAEPGGDLGVEHLESDGAIVLEVLGQVDRGHATGTEIALDPVAVGERG